MLERRCGALSPNSWSDQPVQSRRTPGAEVQACSVSQGRQARGAPLRSSGYRPWRVRLVHRNRAGDGLNVGMFIVERKGGCYRLLRKTHHHFV